MRYGKVKICGCRISVKKHGDCGSRLYNIWRHLKQRCTNKYYYEHYGSKQIKVCAEWQDYKKFKEWALSNGYKDGLSIDRIDYDGDYTPDNCRWANRVLQNANRSLQHNNKSGYRGINWYKRTSKWRARVSKDHKHVELGLFDTVKEALECRNSYIIEHNLPNLIQLYVGEPHET